MNQYSNVINTRLRRSIDIRVYLVDERVAEDTGTVDDDIDAGTTEFFERDRVQSVDPTQGIGDGLNSHHQHDLGEVFAVGFDIIGTAEDTSDRFGISTVIIAHLPIEQPVHYYFG